MTFGRRRSRLETPDIIYISCNICVLSAGELRVFELCKHVRMNVCLLYSRRHRSNTILTNRKIPNSPADIYVFSSPSHRQLARIFEVIHFDLVSFRPSHAIMKMDAVDVYSVADQVTAHVREGASGEMQSMGSCHHGGFDLPTLLRGSRRVCCRVCRDAPNELYDGKQVQKDEHGVTAAGGGGCRTIVVDACLGARALLCFSASARNLFIVLVGMDRRSKDRRAYQWSRSALSI